MQPDPTERRLAAILFTDIVGYTALMAASEERGLRAHTRHRTLVQPLVRSHHGESIEAKGDESLSVFPNVLDAVHCALEVEDRLRGEPDLRLHIGIHLGDVVVRDGEVSGDGVNIASRICALSPDGGIRVSGEVHRAVRNQPDVESVALGEHQLKNVGQPVAVFAVGRPGTLAAVRRSARRGRLARRAPLWAGVLVAIAAAAYLTFGTRSPIDAGTPLTSIAVLPFDDLSPNGDSAWLGNAMAEELIETLSRIEAFRVVARTSTEIAKKSGLDLDAIGEALRVGSVVEGSVQRSGDQLRITAQLIRVADHSHLWSARYDRRLDDIFAVQQQIARDIAEAIRVELGVRTSWSWLEREQYVPRDVRAYELVRRGYDLMLTGQPDDILKARNLLRRAIQLDPDYAAAHAALAWDHYIAWLFVDSRAEQKQRARDSATRAIELDSLQAPAHALLGQLSALDWDLEAALKRFERVKEISPEGGGLQYGSALLDVGRIDEGCAELERDAELNPLSPTHVHNAAFAHMLQGEYDAAIEGLERALALNPLQPFAAGELGMIYHLKGMDAEALEAYLRAPEVDPEIEASLRRGFQENGWPGMNKAFIQALADRSGRRCSLEPAGGAHLYARAAESDEMYRCLELAIEERGNVFLNLGVNLSWAPYHDEPRFQAILRRVGMAK